MASLDPSIRCYAENRQADPDVVAEWKWTDTQGFRPWTRPASGDIRETQAIAARRSIEPEGIGWQFASEDTRLAHIGKTTPGAIKVRQIPGNNFIGLIDAAAARKSQEKKPSPRSALKQTAKLPRFLDYAFLAHGKKTKLVIRAPGVGR